MNQITRMMMLVFMIIYVVSPLDACPGPIEDVIVFLISLAAQKK